MADSDPLPQPFTSPAKPLWFLVVRGCLTIAALILFIVASNIPGPPHLLVWTAGMICGFLSALSWVAYGVVERFLRLRYGLGTLMLVVLAFSSSVTMIVSKNDKWITCGIMGLILTVALIISALARAGGNGAASGRPPEA
jgi:hypothetical protein